MKIELDGVEFDVFITRKNIKNMYLRVKSDGIYISCHYLVTKGLILDFIERNSSMILKSNEKIQKKKGSGAEEAGR